MKREYKDYNLELNLPENFYLINPKKYKELNLKSIDQMNLIDAFAVKEEDVISNIVSFYECEDFEFDKIIVANNVFLCNNILVKKFWSVYYGY